MSSETTISLIIPTRNRPDRLKRAVASVIDTADRPDLLEIVVGVDHDDATASILEAHYADFKQVRVLMSPRHDVLGALMNTMAAATTGQIIGGIVDDIEFKTQGWDRSTRATLDPRPMVIAHPLDPQVGEGFVGEPFVTRTLYDFLVREQGFYFPIWFPYWFNDTWFTELGFMTSLKLQMPWHVPLTQDRPGTIGLRNLKYWAQFFDHTRPLRVRTAKAWLEAALPPAEAAQRIAFLPRAIEMCGEMTAHLSRPDFVAHWEGQHDGPDNNERHIRARKAADETLRELGVTVEAD